MLSLGDNSVLLIPWNTNIYSDITTTDRLATGHWGSPLIQQWALCLVLKRKTKPSHKFILSHFTSVHVKLWLVPSLHEKLSHQVGQSQQDEEAVEDSRRPAECPLSLLGDHVHQSWKDEHQSQAACSTREPVGRDRGDLKLCYPSSMILMFTLTYIAAVIYSWHHFNFKTVPPLGTESPH